MNFELVVCASRTLRFKLKKYTHERSEYLNSNFKIQKPPGFE